MTRHGQPQRSKVAAPKAPSRLRRSANRGATARRDQTAKPKPIDGSRTGSRTTKATPAGLATLREVARHEFAARGYHAVSIRDMATEAGLSLSVLYHYFATKQELLFDILNEAIDDFHAVLARHAWENASSDPLERFLILVASMVEYRARSPIDSILFIREVRNLDPQYAKQIGVRRSAAQDLFEQVIGDGIDSGVFKTPYPDDAHRAIIAMLNAIPEWYRPSGKLKVENLVARYSRLGLAIVEYVGDLDTLPEN